MLAYLFKRLLMTLLVLLVVMVFLALLVNIVPGDAAKTLLGNRATPELIARVRADMDLDKPVHIQVARFVWNMLHGSFGNDVFSGQPISRSIGSALPHTLILAWVALGLAVLVGIPLGVFSATHPELLDRPGHGDLLHLLHHAALLRGRAVPAAAVCGPAPGHAGDGARQNRGCGRLCPTPGLAGDCAGRRLGGLPRPAGSGQRVGNPERDLYPGRDGVRHPQESRPVQIRAQGGFDPDRGGPGRRARQLDGRRRVHRDHFQPPRHGIPDL